MSARAEQAPLPTVTGLDLKRYMGKWYDIASLPQRFQRGCTATVAEYSLKPDAQAAASAGSPATAPIDEFQVINTCNIGALSGPTKIARGTGRIPDLANPAKIKITFFWPFSGDYWILDLGPNYEYALVGDPTRNYLWILSRTRQMDPTIYENLLKKSKELGFDITRIAKIEQPLEPKSTSVSSVQPVSLNSSHLR